MTTTVAIAKIDLGDVGEWIASLGAVLASAVAIGIAFWSHRNEKGSAADRRLQDLIDADRRDLDETRRLLVILLMFGGRSNAIGNELLGTIANALARRADLMSLPDAVGLLRQWEGQRDTATRQKINELIEKIDRQLSS